MNFYSNFSKFAVFGMLDPPKQLVVLKVLAKNKVFYFQKRHCVWVPHSTISQNKSQVYDLDKPFLKIIQSYLRFSRFKIDNYNSSGSIM